MSKIRYEFQMGLSKENGWTYFIRCKITDRVISCWAVGSKIQVEKLASDYCDSMNERDVKERFENKHQKTQTMTSSTYC